jgi:hypothetical protein
MLLPGTKQIPFCAYNTIGYREHARLNSKPWNRSGGAPVRRAVDMSHDP